MPEDGPNKRDRELIELLNELRVALPGIQVLFAFLLIVPFSQGYDRLSSTEVKVYFAAFLCASAATAFLIAPTAYHRVQWRARDKERLLQTSNVLALIGMVFLALAVTCTVYVITAVLFGTTAAVWTTAINAGVFSFLWFGLPLISRATHKKRGTHP